MLVPGDLGFPGLSLVFFFLVVPIISFVIRWKWRIAVERQREIMRLVAVAAEEAARAELEAAAEYGTVSIARQSQCAVCFCPTTTRCSRCKAVRYCSGKCQIIHWRQGHKEECNPPSIGFQFNGPGSDFDQNVALQELHELYGSSQEAADRSYTKPVHKFTEKPAALKSSYSPEFLSGKCDGKVGSVMDPEGMDNSFESFSVSSVVDSFTSNSSESTADVSMCEDPVSCPLDRLEQPQFDDVSCDRPGTRGHPNDSEFTVSQPSKLDNTVNDISCLRKLNQTAPSCTVGADDCGPARPPCPSINVPVESNSSKLSTIHSDFWEGTFDSNDSGYDIHDDSVRSGFSEETEDHLLDEAYPSISRNKMSNRVSLPDKKVRDAPNLKSSTTLSSERSAFVDSISSASQLLKSKETRSLSSISFDKKPSSTMRGQSSSSMKASVVDCAHKATHRVPTSSSEISNSSSNGSTGLKTFVQKVHQFKVYKLSKHNSVRVGSESAEKYNYKMLFPYDMFVKLYHWNKVELRPCGLMNCGNSCYANAVLQSLAFTRPLTAYLLQGLHSKACPKKEWCFTCEFEGLILKAKEGKSPLSPIGILSQLHSIGSPLGHGKEEDAHEFLRYAIDTMQSVCLKEAGKTAVGPLAEETTLIGLIFGGYLRSKIKCMKCHGKSERHERMMDLTVEIQGEIGTLEEALKQFTATEILDGENKYQCNRCKSYQKAKKKLTVMEAPNVLTIALKRFQGGKFGKLNKSVKFPEILNLAPYMSGTSDKSPIYRLYAVVVHLDIMNAAFSGHYVCYVSNLQGKWFKIDDSTVKPVELDRVLSKEAYMLLYSRCSPRAPSLIRSTCISGEGDVDSSSQRSEALRCTYSGKSNMAQPGPNPTSPGAGLSAAQRAENHHYWTTLDGAASFESFDSFDRRFHPLNRIHVDSSSDNSSLLSCSDEGSCSTESTRDSTDEFTDYIFGGETGRSSWNCPSRSTEDCNGSSSPLFRRSSPSHSAVLETSGYPTYMADKVAEVYRRQPRKSCIGSQPFSHSDASEQCRNLTGSSNSCSHSYSSSSSSNRETDMERLGWCNPWEVKRGVSQRRSTRDRTTHTLY